jgi:hypothetical protein
MKFEFKEVPVPRKIRRQMVGANVRAYKVRVKGGDVVGVVCGSELGSKPGWGRVDGDRFHGGQRTRHDAAEALAKS